LKRMLPRAVEPVIRDLVRDTCAHLIPFDVAYAGRHWGAGSEFDAVFLDAERRQAFILEIKWTEQPVQVGLLDELKRKASQDPALARLERTQVSDPGAGVVVRAARRALTLLPPRWPTPCAAGRG